MECEIQNREDYSKELLCYKNKVRIRYYGRRRMKALYPHRNFWVAGEIGGRSGILCGVARNTDGQSIPVYREKTHNGFMEAVIGYVAVDSHTYLAVVKNDLPRRILMLTLVLALIGIVAVVAFEYCIH